MNIQEATEIVRQIQRSYFRGELPPEVIAAVLEISPNATKDWNKMLVQLNVEKKKLQARVRNLLIFTPWSEEPHQ